MYSLTGIGLLFINYWETSFDIKDGVGEMLPINIAEWVGTDIVMDKTVFSMIQPDVLVFRDYKNKRGNIINVYIGYYHSMDKSDLAHSPLVCYPGQGWDVKDVDVREVGIDGFPGGIQVHPLVIEKGRDTDLVWYWYQTIGYSTASVGKMRIKLFLNKLKGRDTSNCFIRISIPIQNGNLEEGEKILHGFIQEAYPSIYEHLKI